MELSEDFTTETLGTDRKDKRLDRQNTQLIQIHWFYKGVGGDKPDRAFLSELNLMCADIT